MMFSQPFFAAPMGSRSYYEEPLFAPAPRRSYFYDDAFPFAVSPQPAFQRRAPPSYYARPAYESSDEDDDSYSLFPRVGRRDECTCGRCPRTAPGMVSKAAPGPQRRPAKRGSSTRSSPAKKAPPSARASSDEEPIASSPVGSPQTSQSEERPDETVLDVSQSEEMSTEDVATSPDPVKSHGEPSVENDAVNEERGDEDADRERAQVLASFTNVTAITKDIDSLHQEVEQFTGTKQSKDYLRLEDTLTRVLLRLDMVESFGDDKVRSVRRKAVRNAQDALELLESKVKVPTTASDKQPMVTDEPGAEDECGSDDVAEPAEMDASSERAEDDETSPEDDSGMELAARDDVLVDVDSESDSDSLDTSILFGS